MAQLLSKLKRKQKLRQHAYSRICYSLHGHRGDAVEFKSTFVNLKIKDFCNPVGYNEKRPAIH